MIKPLKRFADLSNTIGELLEGEYFDDSFSSSFSSGLRENARKQKIKNGIKVYQDRKVIK